MNPKEILTQVITQATTSPDDLMRQKSAAPTRKVTAAGAGALAGLPVGMVISWGITAATGIPVPEEVGNAIVGAVTGLFAFGSAYMTKEKRVNMPGGDR